MTVAPTLAPFCHYPAALSTSKKRLAQSILKARKVTYEKYAYSAYVIVA